MRARREHEALAMPATRALNEGDGKKQPGDDFASRNEKVSELWRPGAGFKPTTFLDPKGPKVPRALCPGPAPAGRALLRTHLPCADALVNPQLAFVTTTSDSFRQIKLWTSYHQSLGVGRFYLFVDGQV